jgi:hypothetical protein
VALLVLVPVALATGTAYAWPTGEQFDGDPVSEGGGGGNAFTGSTRHARHDCAVCHTDPPRTLRLTVEADPVALFDGYKPGATYKMRVKLRGEHAAVSSLALGDACVPTVDKRCDDNGFALEIDDLAGAPRGSFAPLGADGSCGATAPAIDAETYVLAAGDAVVHSGYHHGLDAWGFCWTAPPAGSGPLTLFAAVVDGNGGSGNADNPDDTVGDDVASGSVALAERGGVGPAAQSGGCTIVAASGGRDAWPRGLAMGAAFVVALTLLGSLRRRRDHR